MELAHSLNKTSGEYTLLINGLAVGAALKVKGGFDFTPATTQSTYRVPPRALHRTMAGLKEAIEAHVKEAGASNKDAIEKRIAEIKEAIREDRMNPDGTKEGCWVHRDRAILVKEWAQLAEQIGQRVTCEDMWAAVDVRD